MRVRRRGRMTYYATALRLHHYCFTTARVGVKCLGSHDGRTNLRVTGLTFYVTKPSNYFVVLLYQQSKYVCTRKASKLRLNLRVTGSRST